MVKGEAGRWASLAVLFLVGCAVSFIAGRATVRRQPAAAAPRIPASTTEANSFADASTLAITDDDRGGQLAAFQKELSECGWDLIGPIKEFEAGQIDGKALVQRTAEPEMRALRLCTRMHELANEMTNEATRMVATRMTMGLLQRHRGLSMIIEGYGAGDDSRVVAGAKLFEDGRKQVLESAVMIGGPGSDQAASLKRVLEAYEQADRSSR